MTYSIDRSFGEIVSVSNHGQMLVFMSKVPDHLADFSLRRMTEDGLQLVKEIPLEERVTKMKASLINGFIGKELNYKVSINDVRDIAIQISDAKDD